MKNLFRIPIAIFVVSLILVGCSKDGVQEETVNNSNTFNSTLSVDMTPEEESLKFFRKHMAVVDARVRSLSSEKFVREIYLANFSEESWSKNKIGLGGYRFSDDGEGNAYTLVWKSTLIKKKIMWSMMMNIQLFRI